MEDALPDSQIGYRAISLAGMMHYLQGTTLAQILDVYNYRLHFVSVRRKTSGRRSRGLSPKAIPLKEGHTIWLFFGSDRVGKALAILASFNETW